MAALVAEPPRPELVARLADDGDLHAPYLIDVEFLSALRRLVATARLPLPRANDARLDLADLLIVRYPHEGLADRIWTLRDTMSAYDASFVALAELLGAPLVTVDRRLGRTRSASCDIEVF